MFIRNETFYTFRKNYPIVTSIIAIHFILFSWINLSSWGLLPFGDFIFQYGVGYNAAIASGEVWRLVTPIFLHIGVSHVLFNSFSLVLFGPALEKILGKLKFITFYLTTGALANLATFFLTGPLYQHLGASGAIFGLFGIYLFMVLNRKDLIDAGNAQIIVVISVIGVVMTFFGSQINVVAHVFGLIAGFLVAPFFLKTARPFSVTPVIRKRSASHSSRWKKREIISAPRLARIIGWAFVILVLIGIVNRLFL